MRDIKEYILENNTQDEDLQDEVGLALKEFGNVRNGFKPTTLDKIEDKMYYLEFDYDEGSSDDEKLVFVGNYIDTEYEVDLYIDKKQGNNITLKNFNVFKI